MKVAVVSHLFPTADRPLTGVFVREQAEALARVCEVRVVSPQFLPARLSPPLDLALPTEYASLPWHRRLPSSVSVALAESAYEDALERALRRGMPDVIHAHYGFPDGVAAIRVGRRLGLPVLVTLHGTDVNRQLQRPVVGRILARKLAQADAVVCVSQEMKRVLASVWGPLADKTVTVPNGYNAAEIGFAEETDLTHVLFVGSLIPVKNVDVLLRAYAAAGERAGLPLLIVGDGPLRDALRSLAAELGVADRVTFAGPVPHDQLRPMYAGASALVVPSRSEGMPVVAIEALASGVPVIASRVGDLPRMIREGQNGLTVPSGDVAALAEALVAVTARTWDRRAIASDPALRTWDDVAASLLTLYDGMWGRAS
ncbi:MAG TPA: glycosyltransferase [Coriobacteriia bacterium]